jgi:hypothetical protein
MVTTNRWQGNAKIYGSSKFPSEIFTQFARVAISLNECQNKKYIVWTPEKFKHFRIFSYNISNETNKNFLTTNVSRLNLKHILDS